MTNLPSLVVRGCGTGPGARLHPDSSLSTRYRRFLAHPVSSLAPDASATHFSAGMLGLVTAAEVRDALAEVADPEDAVFLQRFFKTGRGQYGDG
ncbi:MAG: hypothetical protein ABUT11_04900, partial [Leifsonia sp.]